MTKLNKTEPVPTQAEKRENPEHQYDWWWKFLAYSIPAYTYFFGYVSQSYYLEGLGFDEADVSGEPGPVYQFAFNSFFFLNSEALKTAWPKYFETLSTTWWQPTLLALAGGSILYILVKFMDYWNQKQDKKQKQDKQEGKAHKPHLLFSVFMSIATLILHLGSVPLVIIGMTIISAIFIPAPLTGLAMAEKEITEFTCDLPKDNKAAINPCTNLILSNGREVTGNIKYKDKEYTYIYTEDGPQAVPLRMIEQRIRYINPLSKTPK